MIVILGARGIEGGEILCKVHLLELCVGEAGELVVAEPVRELRRVALGDDLVVRGEGSEGGRIGGGSGFL